MKFVLGLVMLGGSAYVSLLGKEHSAILFLVLGVFYFIMDRLDDIERKIK